jgi:hypothetical protein
MYLTNKYKKPVFLIVFIAASLLLMLTAGCGSSNQESAGDTVLAPTIEISYTADLSNQTASGYLTLVVNITAVNRGYKNFRVSPDIFSATVGDYAYFVDQSDLKAVTLADGEISRGQLTFLVPADAALPGVGYQLNCTNQDQYNIKWIEIPKNPSGVSETVMVPTITITYSETYMWVKETSSLYLLVYITIRNQGYESFNTNPEYFTLQIGEIFGKPGPQPPVQFDGLLTNARDGSYSDMRAYDLQNGAEISGVIAFKVPVTIFKSMESEKISYSGIRDYHIEWVKTAPNKM